MGSPATEKAVYLLHGIRDFGEWTTRWKRVFQQHGIKAESKHLGWISPLQFLVPGQVYSDKLDDVIKDLSKLERKELTIVAHSYASWFITRLLSAAPSINVHCLIVCNSVVPKEFDWHRLTNVKTIISLCGNRDIWPCVAEIASSRFGATGTIGCQHMSVDDHYFDAAHGEMLTEDFCAKHILPLVKDGTRIEGQSRSPNRAVRLLQYANANRILFPIVAVGLLGSWWLAPNWVQCSVSSCYVDVVRTDDLRNSTQDGTAKSYVVDTMQAYTFNYDETEVLVRARKTTDCEVVRGKEVFNEPLIQQAVYDVLADPGKALDVNDRNDCHLFWRIPVRRRMAIVRIYTEDAQAFPDGSGISIPFNVRNFTLTIVPPSKTVVQQNRQDLGGGTVRSYARYTGGQLVLADKPANNCSLKIPPADKQSDPVTLSCPDLWLLPNGYAYHPFLKPFRIYHEGDRFLFCFSIANWKGPTKGDRCSLR